MSGDKYIGTKVDTGFTIGKAVGDSIVRSYDKELLRETTEDYTLIQERGSTKLAALNRSNLIEFTIDIVKEQYIAPTMDYSEVIEKRKAETSKYKRRFSITIAILVTLSVTLVYACVRAILIGGV